MFECQLTRLVRLRIRRLWVVNRFIKMKIRIVVNVVFLAVAVLVVRAQKFNICPSRCPDSFGCNFMGRCHFGRDQDYCNCCTRCFKWPGEICGGSHGVFGKCLDGYYCDKSGSKKGRTLPNPVGYCRSITEDTFCPQMVCVPEKCPKLSCPYGTGLPACGCCMVCLKGLGEECSPFTRCGKGLYCDESFARPFDEPGGTCKIWSIFPLFNRARSKM